MKVSRSSKSRAAGRHDQAMRPVHETVRNYRWWYFQDTEPADGYVLEEHTYWEPARPRRPEPVTRKPKHDKLSRTALRKRLYRQNVPKSLWPELLATYAGRGQTRSPGQASVKESWGYSVAKAVTRHVNCLLVVLDEFGYYAQPGLADAFRSMRKHNGVVHTVTQTLPEDFKMQFGAMFTAGAPADAL